MTTTPEEMPRRLYISGLSHAITTQDLDSRLATFGNVSNIQIAESKGQPKGFAHLTLTSTLKQYNKFVSAYQNSKWKGSQMKIQIATPSYLDKLAVEWSTPLTIQKEKLTRKESKRRATAVHGDNMTPIQDADTLRMGWRKGKYGVSVCVVNMRAHGNAKIDPSRTQHQMKRFKVDEDGMACVEGYVDDREEFELEYAPVVDETGDVVDEIEHVIDIDALLESSDEEIEDLNVVDYDNDDIVEDHTINIDSLMNAMDSGTDDDSFETKRKEHVHIEKEDSDYITPAVVPLSEFELETKKSMTIIEKLFKGVPDVETDANVFVPNTRKRGYRYYSDDDEEERILDVVETDKEAVEAVEAEEEVHEEIVVNVEMNDTFMSDDKMSDATSEINAQCDAIQIEDLKHGELDMTTEEQRMETEEEKMEIDDELTIKEQAHEELAVKTVTEEPKFAIQVNTNLRSLVYGDDANTVAPFGGFSLFAQTSATTEPLIPQETLDFLNKTDQEYNPQTDTRREDIIAFQKANNFFMHFGKEDIQSVYAPTYSFMLTQPMEDVQYEWEENRKELTREFKQKHKDALRKKAKSMRYNK